MVLSTSLIMGWDLGVGRAARVGWVEKATEGFAGVV